MTDRSGHPSFCLLVCVVEPTDKLRVDLGDRGDPNTMGEESVEAGGPFQATVGGHVFENDANVEPPCGVRGWTMANCFLRRKLR